MPQHDIDPGLMAIIEVVARRTAEAVMDQHQDRCPIDSVRKEIWGISGNGPGMKDRLIAVESEVASSQSTRAWLGGIAQPIIVAIIVAVLTAACSAYLSRPVVSASSSHTPARGLDRDE